MASEVEIGDVVLEMPDGATPEQIKAAVAKFRTTPEFDALIDKEAGAPIRVRSRVGNVAPKDRLANLKASYPDAVPYGDDNFVFTNPETGRPTLYNEESGLIPSLGDLASVQREGLMMIGGAGGAALGTAGLPGVGTAVGAGLGTAFGGQLSDLINEFIQGGERTEGPLERALDATIDFGSGAVGQRAGEIAPKLAKKALGGLSPKAQRLVQAFRDLAIDAPAGAATGSRSIATAERMLEATPAGGDVLQKQAERVLQQTGDAAKALAAKFGQAKTPEGASLIIRQAAINAAARFGFKQEKIYDQAFDLVGAKWPVRLDNIRALRQTMELELANAPQSMARVINPVLSRMKQLEADGVKGVPFETFRQIRTALGKELDSPVLIGSTGARNASLKRLYGAMTMDMSDTAVSASAKAGKMLSRADKITKTWMNDAGLLMQKIDKMDGDGRAFKFLMTSSRDGGRTIAKMRGNFTDDEWDTITASLLNQMGKATAGAQDATGEVFSPATFLTNFNKLAPEAKKVLFSGKRYAGLTPELDKLTRVLSSLKEVQNVANTSNTGRSMIYYSTLQTLTGALLGGQASGTPEGTLLGAAGALVAPRVAAKLITSPAFAKWLTTPVTSTNALGPHIGRLFAIAKANPEIKDEIAQYAQALRQK